MPHSSGGGSHSGGSHSSGGSSYSSHSSGGGSSSGSHSNRRTSSTPFPGSKMYLYYQDRQPRFIYSNYDIRKREISGIIASLFVLVILFVPIFVMCIAGMVLSFKKPEKISYYNNKKPDIIIEDNLGIFEDEKSLKRAMKDFFDETGIVPAVITVRNEDWNQDYTSLERYAYHVYVDRFPDEAHWLIVYSEEIKPDGFNDWYWEGMQGDRTDPVLTEERANKFTESLHKRLLQREKYSVDEAIAATFQEYTPQMMNIIMNKTLFFSSLVTLLIFGGILAYSQATSGVKTKVPEQYKKAQLVNLTAVYQEACNYCGGVYIVGMHTECPHCGAALPAHHYTKDANGNIVQIM